jgi:hypothetical protein
MTERPDAGPPLRTPECARARDDAAELASGVLPARERAAVLLHLDQCPDCRAHLRQLTLVTDQLLDLVPGIEPPAGFEQRVLDRLGLVAGASPARPEVPPVTRRALRGRDRRRAGPALLAAAAGLALLFGLGGFVAGYRSAGTGEVAEASLFTADHRAVGEVYSVSGEHGWVSMEIDTGGPTELVDCQVSLPGGGTRSIGRFRLRDGKGWWGIPLENAAPPTTARLLRADGTVLATATF